MWHIWKHKEDNNAMSPLRGVGGEEEWDGGGFAMGNVGECSKNSSNLSKKDKHD